MPKIKSTCKAPSKAQRAALDEAVVALGGLVKACATLKVTLSAVGNWRKYGVPPARVLQLESLTRVSRKRLRPDLYA